MYSLSTICKGQAPRSSLLQPRSSSSATLRPTGVMASFTRSLLRLRSLLSMIPTTA